MATKTNSFDSVILRTLTDGSTISSDLDDVTFSGTYASGSMDSGWYDSNYADVANVASGTGVSNDLDDLTFSGTYAAGAMDSDWDDASAIGAGTGGPVFGWG